jgi:SAM-dependent methyltransferase
MRDSWVCHATAVSFGDFVLLQLPPAPVRVLEVGCGYEGGIAPALAQAGYDVVAIDPDAPDGPLYRRLTLEQLDDPGPFAAVVAGRVLHHVDPLAPALDKLAGLAPLLVLDEFAWNHMDEPTIAWYETRHRLLMAAGREAKGPPDLAEWRARHAGLHPYETLRRELHARYEERHFEWRPYFYRWLEDPATEDLEQGLIEAGAIRPIGFRYAGVRRETVRSSADSR